MEHKTALEIGAVLCWNVEMCRGEDLNLHPAKAGPAPKAGAPACNAILFLNFCADGGTRTHMLVAHGPKPCVYTNSTTSAFCKNWDIRAGLPFRHPGAGKLTMNDD